MGEKRNACNILVVKRKRKNALGRYRLGRENSKVDLKEIGWEVMD
jgi:hypothetical protein